MENENIEKTVIQDAFGKVLKRFRTTVGISQERLALECGLDRTYISLLERGLRMPTLFTIMVIAQELDIPLLTIVSETEKQSKVTL